MLSVDNQSVALLKSFCDKNLGRVDNTLLCEDAGDGGISNGRVMIVSLGMSYAGFCGNVGWAIDTNHPVLL